MKKKLSVMLVGAAMIAAFSLTACGGNNASSPAAATQSTATYTLKYSLDYSSNNTIKSDIILKLDGKELQTVSLGSNVGSLEPVNAGNHKISIVSKDDGKELGSMTVNMDKNRSVALKFENGAVTSTLTDEGANPNQ